MGKYILLPVLWRWAIWEERLGHKKIKTYLMDQNQSCQHFVAPEAMDKVQLHKELIQLDDGLR